MALLGASAVDLGPGANEFKLIYMPFYYTFLRRLAAYERVAPAVQTSAKRRQR